MDIKRVDINSKFKLYETTAKEKEIAKENSNPKKSDNTAKSDKTEKSDKIAISISSEAKNLNLIDFAKDKMKYEMSSAANGNAGIEKINALKEQIKSGAYIVNSLEIASAIISGT